MRADRSAAPDRIETLVIQLQIGIDAQCLIREDMTMFGHNSLLRRSHHSRLTASVGNSFCSEKTGSTGDKTMNNVLFL